MYSGDLLDSVVCGDCLDVMRGLPDGSIPLIVTSPPYNLRNSTGGWAKGTKGGSKWKNSELRKGYDGYDDNMPHELYVEWQRACLSEMLRLIPDDGAIFYNHKWRVQGGLIQDRSDIVDGFPVRQILIWQRAGGINFNDAYFLPTYEVIYMIAKPEFRLLRSGLKYGDVWKITPARGNDHPAPFPIELPARIIRSTSAELVLDPFCGSGTTCLAAQTLGRHYIGIDRSQKYCDMATERLSVLRLF